MKKIDGSENRGKAVAVAPTVLREMNQRLLLDNLFRDGSATRPELARAAGLSLPTVNASLAGLCEAGLVKEVGRPERRAHRPATIYEADAAAGHVLAIDLGRSWLRAAISDLAGTELAALDTPNTAESADEIIALVTSAAENTAHEAFLELSDLTHAVVGAPGVLDPGRRSVHFSPNIKDWQRFGVTDDLSAALGTGLTIDNDANLAAIGEHTDGAGQGTDNMIYVHIGTGVGLGLILDGRLYRGDSGAAGEAGYLPLRPPHLTASPTIRHDRGELEEHLAADAVVRHAQSVGAADGDLTSEAIFTKARQNDPTALRALEVEASYLAFLVASVGCLLDPELIVLGGGVGQNLADLEPTVSAELAKLTPFRPRLAPAVLGERAVVRGAIATGIGHARTAVFDERMRRSA